MRKYGGLACTFPAFLMKIYVTVWFLNNVFLEVKQSGYLFLFAKIHIILFILIFLGKKNEYKEKDT